MSSPDTATDGLPARSIYRHMTLPPVRRRSVLKRITMALRDHVSLGAFMAMLIVCAALVIFSR